jgi:DNA-binding transcriptional LysR family regulator
MKHLRLFEYIDAVVRAGSIRRAAESLYITPSALDRRIQQVEEELDCAIFERHAKGMRLNAAGEIFLGYVRRHLADGDCMRSEIEGLKGLRRGRVEVVASQALATRFLPAQINRFRESFPGVSFGVRIVSRQESLAALMAYEADLALVVFPKLNSEILQIVTVAEPVMAMMSRQHPLAGKPELRFSDCLNYPLVLPGPELGARELLDTVLLRRPSNVQIIAETNSFELMRGLLADSQSIGFQVSIGAPSQNEHSDLFSRPVSQRDLPSAPLVCAQLRSRTLSVAAAKFAEQVSCELNSKAPIG